ncbi:flagellar protein FlgN [Desulforamulus hydrothermalis]|uniref:Putative FlgN family protein n=1 Tax=Desulforamulus hydrothermalis Lam5 = DSM 18033 TaxID=1121428 RepID=K8EKS1_9FIRM|nr:flagellar protein FlgN [Desulforamulus hydrothermalis]CCO09141.1 putative FlgN family protein [Desulforamulus hydrothermalis Lam5 = DSM 18033]SHH11791.1 FlgN protein [Desulforamulus hydrothermalis Lam5 = DSM 18033]
MESLFFNLSRLLSALQEKLADMLQATEKHNQALRHNDMEALRLALQELHAITAQTRQLDRQREAVQAALEAQLNLPAGATLSETLQHAPAGLAREMHKTAGSLRQLTEAINSMAALNKILTQNAMQFNQILLAGCQPAQTTYKPGGQATVAAEPLSLLNKTV